MFCACQETTQGVEARREQALAMEVLRESETRFRNMADHAPVFMWVTDPTGFRTYLNPLWYEFTGQTREEAEGYGWLDATHPEDKDESGWKGDRKVTIQLGRLDDHYVIPLADTPSSIRRAIV